MYCFNCGQQLPDESKFCSCCGTRICDNSKFDNESENVINNTPMSDYDVKISGDFSETSKKFFGVVDETKYNEIIGTSYQFSRNIFLGIDKKTHVRFDENEIVCGLFRTKSFKYDDVKEIYGKECFNVGELSCGIICGISGIFLIICMLLTGTDYLWPILIYTIVGFFSFLFAKNYVVTIVDSSNKKLTIKMSKKDGSRDDFIDSLKKITHTNELSVENPSKAKNIFIIAVSVILALSVEFLVVKDSFVSEFNARIDLNSSGSSDKGTNIEKSTELVTDNITQSPKVSKETEKISNTNEVTKELQITDQDGIYKYIGIPLNILKKDLGEPDYDPQTHRSQSSHIGGGFMNSYIYGKKVFEYIEYDYVAVDDNTSVNCVFVSDGEYLSDKVHVGMTFDELSKYINFDSTSPIYEIMHSVAQARSIIDVNGYSCDLVVEFPMNADNSTPSTSIYIWCKEIGEQELENQRQRMSLNQKLQESYEYNGITGYVTLNDTTDVLNLRDSDNTSSVINAKLKHGTAVTIERKVGDWYQVTCDLGSGYVFAEYISFEVPT